MTEEMGTRFAKLNDGNYPTWNIMMEADLVRKKLWNSAIEVTVQKLKTDGTPKTEAEIAGDMAILLDRCDTEKMQEARAEMILRVEPSQLAHMQSKDPRKVWEALRDTHCAHGFATTLAMQRRFMTSRMAVGQSVQSWIGSVRALAFEMEQVGIDVAEHNIILAITLGLPASYETIVILFDAIPTKDLSLPYVISRLLNDETRQNAGIAHDNDENINKNGNVAMMAAGRNGLMVVAGLQTRT